MATQPTQYSVPSESPRDLKFNAGKIDEFATSMGWTYTDRFGVNHYTIEGLRWLAQQSIAAFGYVTIDSFEDGATLTMPNEVLRLEATGEYYRWDGSFLPSGKIVPPASTPANSGGIGSGAWLSVGDATLRSQLPFITFEQFGVKGDGVSDDTLAVKAAAIYANQTKQKLVAKASQRIKITGSDAIEFNYSVDFNGAVVDVSQYESSLRFKRPSTQSQYLPGSQLFTDLQSESTLTGQYFSGWLNTELVNDSFVIIETSQPFFNYSGTVYNRIEYNVCNRYGVMKSPLSYPLDSSLITKIRVIKNEEKTTKVANLNLYLGSNPQQQYALWVEHSRFILENIVVSGENSVWQKNTSVIRIKLQ
ncbi:hypothetical protein OHZ45_003879 [Escherichia coli]|nr:hypothetical protein [Escherichia coli]EJZ1815520.1 hypothetical protein [Escherichia coli]